MRYGNPSKKTRVVNTLKGHSIEFPGRGTKKQEDMPPADPKYPDRAPVVDKDGMVFIYVPAIVRAEVDAAGMEAQGEFVETEEKPVKLKPEDPDVLRKEAFAAFDKLIAAGDRETFAGNGAPKAAAVEKVLGYALTNGEIKDLFPKYQVEKAEAAKS